VKIVRIKNKIVSIKKTPLSMVLIAVAVFLSLFFAYVTFNMLQSSGEVTGQEALWGAAAVFIVLFMALTTSNSKLHGLITSDRLSKGDKGEESQNGNEILNQILEYNKKIQELQAKLVKGAPGPPYYTLEMDERHKIVFNRPEQWLPKDGVIYQYVKKRTSDTSPATFELIYRGQNELSEIYNQLNLGNFDPENVDIDEIYDITANFDLSVFKSAINSFEDLRLVKEYIKVDGIKSLKRILSYTTSAPNGDKVRVHQSGVYVYVPRLKTLYQFTFGDDDEHYLKSSEIFNSIIESVHFL
jgi:hypothetical protein